MKLPTLSVIIPNYNHAEHLPRCLAAVLSQSVPASEVIVIDDASTDASVPVIEQFALEHPSIRLVRNPKNQGVVFGMNRGLDLASGEYVYFAAADDMVLPGIFEKLLTELALHPEAPLACGISEWTEVDSGLSWHVGVGMADKPAFLDPETLVTLEKQGRLLIPSHSTIFKRRNLVEAGKFIPELRWHCDWFAIHVQAFHRGICFVPEVLAVAYIYSTSYHSAGRRNVEQYREVLTGLLARLDEPGHAAARKRVLESGALYIFGWPMLRLLLQTQAHRVFLNGTYLRKSLWHIARLNAKKITPRWLAELYFRVAGYKARSAAA